MWWFILWKYTNVAFWHLSTPCLKHAISCLLPQVLPVILLWPHFPDPKFQSHLWYSLSFSSPCPAMPWWVSLGNIFPGFFCFFRSPLPYCPQICWVFFFLCQNPCKALSTHYRISSSQEPNEEGNYEPHCTDGKIDPDYFMSRLLCYSPVHPGNASDLPISGPLFPVLSVPSSSLYPSKCCSFLQVSAGFHSWKWSLLKL